MNDNQNINNNNNNVNNNVQEENNNMDMVELANDISESKGILNDDTTTKPQDDFSDKTINAVEKVMNTTDYTRYFGSDEVKQYKLYGTLCYIPLVAFYFKYFKKLESKSNYMKYHIKEGVNLSLFWILTVVVSKVLYAMFTRQYLMSTETPLLVKFISFVLYCLSITFTLIGLYNTNAGKSKDLPLIGKYKFLK